LNDKRKEKGEEPEPYRIGLNDKRKEKGEETEPYRIGLNDKRKEKENLQFAFTATAC
jgi:hypothetical protein